MPAPRYVSVSPVRNSARAGSEAGPSAINGDNVQTLAPPPGFDPTQMRRNKQNLAADEVQTVALGAATAGNVQLAFDGKSTAAPLAAPAGLAAAPVVGGGAFAAASYFWKITAINAFGETIASNEATAAIALNGSANLTWGAVPGATGYRIYRSAATNGQNASPAFVAAVGAVTAYTDTGAATTAGSVPASNTTAIAFNSTAATVQTFLNAAGLQDIVATGGPFPGAITLTYSGPAYRRRNVVPIAVTPTGLTGGVVTVTTVTDGSIDVQAQMATGGASPRSGGGSRYTSLVSGSRRGNGASF